MSVDPAREPERVSRTGDGGDFPGDGVGASAGVAAAIEAAGPLLPLRDVEQLALPVGGDAIHSREVQQQPRGRGRPRGAPNKRSEAVRTYLLSRYAHPLEVLAQTYSRPADVLASELGCSKIEAAALQVKCAVELAPYLEGKMPVSVDLRTKSDVVLVMTAPGQAAATAAAIGEHGIEAIDWSTAEVSPVAPEMADFRHLEEGE